MSGAGGVTSMGSTFGFLGGRLWGRGRLTAPPTAAVEPNRDINKTTTTSIRHHAAAILWILRDWFKWDWNVLVSNLFSTTLCLHCCIGLFSPHPVCLLSAGPVCFTQSPIWTAGIAQKDRIHETNSWDTGWLVMFNINWVYWQNEVMLQQCSVHIWSTEGSLACYRLNCHQEKNTAEHMVHLCTQSPNFTLWYQTVWEGKKFIQTLHLLQLINFKSWIENSDFLFFFFFSNVNFIAYRKRVYKKGLIFLLVVRLVLFSAFKCEGHTVDTEPLARWLWSIIKHVTQVGVTLSDTYKKNHYTKITHTEEKKKVGNNMAKTIEKVTTSGFIMETLQREQSKHELCLTAQARQDLHFYRGPLSPHNQGCCQGDE